MGSYYGSAYPAERRLDQRFSLINHGSLNHPWRARIQVARGGKRVVERGTRSSMLAHIPALSIKRAKHPVRPRHRPVYSIAQ
jgi:hypothetical protein